MSLEDWTERVRRQLAQRRDRSLLRKRLVVRPIDAVHVEIDSVSYVNFCSNNYLALTHHPKVLSALQAAEPAGAGAAGLISGYTDAHASLEARLAEWKGTEAAVVLPSGYQANLAAVQTIHEIGKSYSGGARFILDKLAHASLIDAVALTGAPIRVIPHNGLSKLSRLLEQADGDQLQVMLTESIFSMDGDACDLPRLADLKRKHPFLLLLDEAHGSGVYGPNGAGLAAELGLSGVVDVSIVTLSKALGCSGGAVCASREFCDALLNFGRAYIYSTSISPAVAAAAAAAIEVIHEEPQRQQRLRELALRLRAALGVEPSDSPILPIVLESERAALDAAEELKCEGMLVLAIRPPAVPPGCSRLRVTLSCAHSDDEVKKLAKALMRIRRAARP